MSDPENPPNPRAFLPLVVIVAVALLGGLIFVAFDRGDEKVVIRTPAPVAPAPTVPSSVADTATTAPLPTDLAVAVWPAADSSQRFDDPAAAALNFATELAGFTAPVLGPFVPGPGGPSAGSVDVRPTADGPITSVQVQQLGVDASWWVTASTTPNIVVTDPIAGSVISSPVALRGSASAFEGTVDVEIRADGLADPLATGFVTGSGDGTLGPFDSPLDFTTPPAPLGTILFLTHSAENGQVWEATVVRVRYSNG